MVYVFFFLLSVYIVFLLLVLAGWQKAVETVPEKREAGDLPMLSVIVPFRNEAKNLPQIIASLKEQLYDHFEVMFVDDHSTDNGGEVAAAVIAGDERFRLIRSQDEGKKRAITAAVDHAKGSVIVTTDADCTFHPLWLASIARAFSSADTALSFGTVRVDSGNSLLGSMQSLEFSTVLASGVAAHAWGFPMYCNGANLAFRKDVFSALGGYSGNFEVPSGDDSFLMEKVLRSSPGGVTFIRNPESTVTTRAEDSLAGLFWQRLRWAGKWRFSRSATSGVTALFILVVQLSILGTMVWLFTGGAPATLKLIFFAKVSLEFVLIFNVSRFLGQKPSLPAFLLLLLVYPLYVITIGLSSLFLPYVWKGRKLSHATAPPRYF